MSKGPKGLSIMENIQMEIERDPFIYSSRHHDVWNAYRASNVCPCVSTLI